MQPGPTVPLHIVSYETGSGTPHCCVARGKATGNAREVRQHRFRGEGRLQT